MSGDVINGRVPYSGESDHNVEKGGVHYEVHIPGMETSPETSLHRGLKARHVSMIAIGGAIGTGLIVGTGKALAQAGPGSLFISYTIIGFLIFIVMSAVGEMASWLPMSSSFTGYATRYCDPSLGFALGWTYWLKYAIGTPNQLTAAALIIQFWLPRETVNPGVWIAIFMVAIVLINFLGIKWFGEFEFWLSSFKVVVIVGVIIFSLVLACGGGPNHDATGFRYWRDPGAFKEYIGTGSWGRFLGFWSTMINAIFAFFGTELVAVTAAEAQNPRKTIPKATRLTFYRILFFYCLSVLLVGMLVPYNSTDLAFANMANTSAAASPFVVAAKLAGIPVMSHIVNTCILFFVFSASNSDLYIASRTMYSLASTGNAPAIFRRTNRRGVPIYALGISAVFSLLAFMNVSSDSTVVFGYFVNVATILALLTWTSILVTHVFWLRARKAQNIPNSILPYYSPFGIWGSYLAIFFCVILALTKNFDVFTGLATSPFGITKYKTFITAYIGIPAYLSFLFGHKLITRSRTVKAHEADFYTGKAIIDQEEEEFLADKEARRQQQEATGKRGMSWFYRTFVSWLF